MISTVYIVGKGQSLKHLMASHFADGFVITINEAIRKVEKLNLPNKVYSMQKDGASPFILNCQERPCSKCIYNMVYPKTATLIVHEHESKYCMEDYSPRKIFNNNDYGLEWSQFSAISAVRLAESWGANRFVMLCFDSITNGSDISIMNTSNITGIYLGQGRTRRADYSISKPYLLNEMKDRNHIFVEPK